jgi:membrane protease YdiL (CAAX protease family)
MPVRALVALLVAIAGSLLGAWLLTGASAWVRIVATQMALLIAVAVAAGDWRPGLPTMRHLGLGLALAIPTFLVSLLIGAVTVAIFGQPAHEPVTQALHELHAHGGWPLLVCLACVGAGLAEEALFRGVILHHLRRRLPPWTAIALAAVAFAAMHASPWRFAPQLCLGLALGWATHRWSWWTAAVAHAGHNGCVLALVWLTPAAA